MCVRVLFTAFRMVILVVSCTDYSLAPGLVSAPPSSLSTTSSFRYIYLSIIFTKTLAAAYTSLYFSYHVLYSPSNLYEYRLVIPRIACGEFLP
ncbi:hypothetical protein EV702DRAFT_1119322 [Suillus placidus]|uniref:Uncharacterized protein n=1 Tax=Suillus placidus TaxID=48579 RepID=A0A9P7D016_9AGAM|nr:hypothetical protein EV702DRAFT_1119322 [Suillus placidus]